MADEASVAVLGRIFVQVDGVDECSGVGFVDDGSDSGHALGVVSVAEAMPQNDGKGGWSFGILGQDFLLGEGQRDGEKEEEETKQHDCDV